MLYYVTCLYTQIYVVTVQLQVRDDLWWCTDIVQSTAFICHWLNCYASYVFCLPLSTWFVDVITFEHWVCTLLTFEHWVCTLLTFEHCVCTIPTFEHWVCTLPTLDHWVFILHTCQHWVCTNLPLRACFNTHFTLYIWAVTAYLWVLCYDTLTFECGGWRQLSMSARSVLPCLRQLGLYSLAWESWVCTHLR